MSIRKQHPLTDTFYFCTITCFEWISLFRITHLYDFIYKWFGILNDKKIKIVGYVIMPNHLHLIIFLPKESDSINRIIANGKRFMAYEIVKRLEDLKDFELLNRLEGSVQENERIKGKLHNVFQPSFDVKNLVTEKFIVQKLNYIHANPIRGRWNLTNDY